MKDKKVQIKFQYYEVKHAENTLKVYDLRNWIGIVEPLTYEQKLKEVTGIRGRIEKIEFFAGEYYALNFMRMEVVSNTYIVQENAQAKHVDLKDDEYIGKNTVALYDPRYNVLMIQCNRGSYGVAGIESYINAFQDESEKIRLCPIFNNIEGILKDDQKVLKIDVRFSNTRNLQVNERFFEKIVDACEEVECLTAHIEFGIGHDKQKELNKETVSALICDLKKNKKNVSSAKIALLEDQKSTIYDLLENIDHDILYFTCPARGELRFQDIIEEMTKRYDDISRARIANLVRKV